MKQDRILWRGVAQLDTRSLATATTDDLTLINAYTASGAATADDVYVCSALVCNDQVDHYSTRFTERALEQIAGLVPGANLMRNHNEWASGDLPIGRVFRAERVDLGGVRWVRVWLYWERGTAEGDAMAKRVSLGIWREVSLSWWMRSFTNSVDGRPFDESPYYPGQELPGGEIVIGIMDDVTEVNEVSVVARGGQKGTKLGEVRGADDEDVRDRVLAMRARSRGVDVEAAGAFARYSQRPQPKPMADFYAKLGIGTKK